MGDSFASVSPRPGVNRNRPLRWLDHSQREQKEGSEGATKNCMKSVIVLDDCYYPLWSFLLLQLVTLISLRALSGAWTRSFLVDSNA